MSRPRMAVRTPRELQLERFLSAVSENGNRQLIEEFLAAFSKIAPPVHPKTSAAPVNAVNGSYVVRGFWVAAASTEGAADRRASHEPRQRRQASRVKYVSYGSGPDSTSDAPM